MSRTAYAALNAFFPLSRLRRVTLDVTLDRGRIVTLAGE